MSRQTQRPLQRPLVDLVKPLLGPRSARPDFYDPPSVSAITFTPPVTGKWSLARRTEPLGVPVDQPFVNERLGRRYFFAGKPVVALGHDEVVCSGAVQAKRHA